MENENFVAETTENVEQTTEQTPKTYTQEEVDAIVGKRIARKEARIRKEYDRKYGDLEGVLKAGMGKEDVGEITEDLRVFYGSKKGIKLPEKLNYSAQDIEVLAKAEAQDLIKAGFEDVTDELNRLSDIGVQNMSAREKALFRELAEYHKEETQQLTATITDLKISFSDAINQQKSDMVTALNNNTVVLQKLIDKLDDKK